MFYNHGAWSVPVKPSQQYDFINHGQTIIILEFMEYQEKIEGWGQ